MKQAQQYQRVEKAIHLLVDIAPERLSLERLGEAVGLSAFQFQREFSNWAGISPLQFSRVLTREFLLSRMSAPQSLDAIANDAGLSSTSRLHDLFVTLDAVTPQEYRSGGKDLLIEWGVHATPLGQCFIATTPRGICNLEFFDGKEAIAQTALATYWPAATLCRADKAIAAKATALMPLLSGETQAAIKPLRLQLKGTNFQIKVWQALLRLPAGSVASYSQIARAIGKPTAHRAVANAIGANPVAGIIPCHRVIQRSGALGGYRWDPGRKAALLGLENRL